MASTRINAPSPTSRKNGSTAMTGTGNGGTGSSPPAPQALLNSSADLSPGITHTIPQQQQEQEHQSQQQQQERQEHDIIESDQRTPTARQQSTSTSRLVPPDRQLSSRPTSQTSFVSTSSLQSSLHSPLCTPKVRDFAYPKQHKYHAPTFNSRRYSVSSQSSTSSDLDGFFPNRMGAQVYVSEDLWKAGDDPEEFRGDEDDDAEEEELVEKRAVCVFDFAAECEGEISIEIGQVVWVEFRKGVSGWLVVKDEITGKFQFSCKERD